MTDNLSLLQIYLFVNNRLFLSPLSFSLFFWRGWNIPRNNLLRFTEIVCRLRRHTRARKHLTNRCRCQRCARPNRTGTAPYSRHSIMRAGRLNTGELFRFSIARIRPNAKGLPRSPKDYTRLFRLGKIATESCYGFAPEHRKRVEYATNSLTEYFK